MSSELEYYPINGDISGLDAIVYHPGAAMGYFIFERTLWVASISVDKQFWQK